MTRRTLWAAGASLAVLASASGAGAQDVMRETRAANAAAHDLEITRQDMLATQREVTARQDQASTAALLRQLDQQRDPTTAPVLRPSTIEPANAGASAVAVQMDRLERLTQDAMARSNARVRAVRPASER